MIKSPTIPNDLDKTNVENKHLTMVLTQEERARWKKYKLSPDDKKTKRRRLKLLCQLIEDYLERDLETIENKFGFSTTKTRGKETCTAAEQASTDGYISKFNTLLYNLFGHDNAATQPDIKWKDSAATTFEHLKSLRTIWNGIKLILDNQDRLYLEHATLPILIKETPIHIDITENNSTDTEATMKIKTVPNILIYSFIRFLDGLPLECFARCKYEKCGKHIIVTTVKKSYCTYNNCGSRASIDRQRDNDPEAFKKRDRERKRAEYRSKILEGGRS